jgi:phage terminase large subunit
MLQQTTTREIVLPFCPRPWQAKLIDDPAPRIVAVVHRRAGKSKGLMWRGFRRALTEPKPLPRVVHILPFAVMWKRTGLWDEAMVASMAIPGAKIAKSDAQIRFPNGGIWQAGGADNPDSWRGGYADECIIDEFDDTPPSMVPLVIEPMLADRDGVLVRSGTPKGRGLLQAAFDRANKSDEYSTYLLDYKATGALSAKAIRRLRDEMTDAEFQQELMCSFESPNSGSYYGQWMDEAQREGRITRVLYDPALPVYTSWDLGISDSTGIWFFQISPRGEWRWLKYYENAGVGLEHYAKLLHEQPYVYKWHLLPHDVEVRELTLNGESRRMYLTGIGVRPIVVVPASNPAARVSAARMILPKSWFDSVGCEVGIRLLRAYRRQWNEKMGVWAPEPVRDAATHCADAFGTGVQGAVEPHEIAPIRPSDAMRGEYDPYASMNLEQLPRGYQT